MKRNGFTLIELLAVIIILSIIALIAIPSVNKIVIQSKKSAFELSGNNLAEVIKYTCQLQLLENEQRTEIYTFTETGVSPSLDVKGILPIDGTATVDSSCNVMLNVTNGKFTATKKANEDSVTVLDGVKLEEPPVIYAVYPNGTAVYFNPETGSKCIEGEAVSTTGTKTGCMKWYTFNDGGSSTDTIDLILDHNTTNLIRWYFIGSNVSGPTDVMTQLKNDTSSWTGVPTRTDSYSVNNGTANYTIDYSSYKARLITAAEVATITGNGSFNEITNLYTSWFYLDSNNQTQTVTAIGNSNYAWLFDYTSNCTSYGCNIEDASNSGYWTSTAVPVYTRNVWCVKNTGRLSSEHAESSIGSGVRPVITINKSIIN